MPTIRTRREQTGLPAGVALLALLAGPARAQEAPTAPTAPAATEAAPAASPEKPATEKPATEKPATEKPATEKPATEKPATEKPATTPANIRVERTGSGGKLFRITEGLVVEGQRQKPNAFYVLQRASTPYDWEALDESFLPRILKAAEKAPFDGRGGFPTAPAKPARPEGGSSR